MTQTVILTVLALLIASCLSQPATFPSGAAPPQAPQPNFLQMLMYKNIFDSWFPALMMSQMGSGQGGMGMLPWMLLGST